MDFIAKSIIFFSAPIFLYLSQLSHRFLLTILVVFNPFTVILSIEALQYLSTPRASNYLVLNIETNSEVYNETNKPEQDPYEPNGSRIYCREAYYKLWLISAHLTYLAVFEYYLVGSLQLSVSESSLLLLSYMILLIALIDLRCNKQHDEQFKSCLQSICSLIHMSILAQLAYLNMTFSCAPRMTSLFGTKILIPSDCSYVEDDRTARIAMYCGINSAQIFFCQLAFELVNCLKGKQKILPHAKNAPLQVSE